MATGVNTLSNIMPKILARGLMTLRQRCIMPRIVNSDYSIEAAKKGTTIDVPVPVAVGVSDVAIATTPVGPSALTPAVVQIPLDQWVQNDPIGLSDKELVEIDANEHFLPMQMQEAVKALASNVNQFIFAKYKGQYRGVYGMIGNPSVLYSTIIDPFDTAASTEDTNGVSAATNAKKILNIQLCPRTDRRGVLNFDAEANALDLASFHQAERIMSNVVVMEGEIGRKFGIDWVADDDVPDHTAGSVQETTPTNCKINVTTAVGDVTVSIKDSTNTETLLRGDIIQFANDTDRTYVVIGSASHTILSAGTSVGIYPAMRSIEAEDDLVHVANDHAVNMVFHRDAFAFATRPLLANSQQYSLGNQMISMQDPKTGLILRLEVSRQHKQTVWEFDILYGADLVRPDLAMRIAGAV